MDEDVAFDNMAIADVAFYNDLMEFDDCQSAMGQSFLAADRLNFEEGVGFAGAFVYVVNIRLIMLKTCVDDYLCKNQYRDEFQRYITKLQAWTTHLSNLIEQAYTVAISKTVRRITNQHGATVTLSQYWSARVLRNGVTIRVVRGSNNDVSETARAGVEGAARAARRTAIDAERTATGVVELEGVARAWIQVFAQWPQCVLTGLVGKRYGHAVILALLLYGRESIEQGRDDRMHRLDRTAAPTVGVKPKKS